jgi:thioredoxin-like negative regulator of GroEL
MGGISMSKELYYYSAPWCKPCETLGPIMDQVGKQLPVRKINVDYADPAVINAANIRNVPTVILVENGQEVRRFAGVKTYNQIIDFLNYG